MLCKPKFDTDQWAADNFERASLGDQRRSDRLVKTAAQFVQAPAGSTPKIAPLWKDTKAIYRLLDCPDVNLHNVTEPHRRRVASCGGTQLIISDTTHVDFGLGRKVDGAGPVGPGKSVGFLLHSALAYGLEDESLLGVAGQIAHVRSKRRRGKRRDSRRGKEWTEACLWSDLFRQVGPPEEETTYIHVCDSAADNYETLFTAVDLGCEFVVRCGRLYRHAIDSQGKKRPISAIAEDAEVIGHYELEIPQGHSRPARTALIEIAVESVELPQPRYCSEHIKQSEIDGLQLAIVVAREVDAPEDVEPIRWILLTTLPVEGWERAWEIIGYYEKRWIIEEWHKALKTGCSLEKRQHQDIERLLPLTGILSVVAVLLIQLRNAARQEPERPATEVVPAFWLELLRLATERSRAPRTNRELWRAIAQLGGFLGRRHDGQPGWITIWRGWLVLHTLLKGADLAKNMH